MEYRRVDGVEHVRWLRFKLINGINLNLSYLSSWNSSISLRADEIRAGIITYIYQSKIMSICPEKLDFITPTVLRVLYVSHPN